MTREEAIRCFWYFSNVAGSGKNVVALTRRDKEAFDMAIEALSAEPCEDAISRQAVLDGIDNYIEKAQSTGTKDDFISFEELVVKALPPVTPKQKMGRWIKANPWTKPYCSECGESCFGVHGFDCITTDFCPHCGAKMEESEEA